MKIYHQTAECNLYDTLRSIAHAPQGWNLIHLEHNLPRDASLAPWYERATHAIAEGAFADMAGAMFVLDDCDVVILGHAPIEHIGKALGGQAAELGKNALERMSGMMSSKSRGCYGYDLEKTLREAMLLVSVKRSAYVRAHAAA